MAAEPVEPAPDVLELPGALDLAAAAPLLEALRGRRGAALSLDGSNVQRIGGLCLQILMAARAAWRADGQEFRLQTSDAMAEGLRQMGANEMWEEAA